MRRFRLRTKFLLSLLAISAGLTSATLLIVSYSVQKQIRNSLHEDLRNSVNTYQSFDRQREDTLTRSAELLANLPNVRALMTTQDEATIQDASGDILRQSGSDLLVLAGRSGRCTGNSNDHRWLSTRNGPGVYAPFAGQARAERLVVWRRTPLRSLDPARLSWRGHQRIQQSAFWRWAMKLTRARRRISATSRRVKWRFIRAILSLPPLFPPPNNRCSRKNCMGRHPRLATLQKT